MSNRTMLEFNHDLMPSASFAAPGTRAHRDREQWAINLLTYFQTGDVDYLPNGVTWFGIRHHSDACPLGEPPKGWGNDKETT